MSLPTSSYVTNAARTTAEMKTVMSDMIEQIRKGMSVDYVSTTTYSKGDVVMASYVLYRSEVDDNINNTPQNDDGSNWVAVLQTATTSLEGVVELATQAEVNAGSSSNVVTAATLSSSDLASAVSSNTSDIADNASVITTNTSDIATNTSDIATLQTTVTKKFTSSAQTISSGGLITVSHGLTDENGDAVKPFGVDVYAVCTTDDAGFVAGDTAPLTMINNSGSSDARRNAVKVTTTDIYLRMSTNSNVFIVGNFGTGGLDAVTNSSWDLYITAWY